MPQHFKSEKVRGSAPYAAHINQTLSTYSEQITTFFYRNQNDASAAPLRVCQIYEREMKANRSPEWGRSLQAVIKQLLGFRPELDWPGLSINTLNQFKVYLQEEEELSDNTIHSYVSLLRGMCEYAERSGIRPPRDIFWVETPARRGD